VVLTGTPTAGSAAQRPCRRSPAGGTHTGNTRKIAYDLAGLAHVAALEHKPRDALVYLGAAQALRDATGGPQLPRTGHSAPPARPQLPRLSRVRR
jgi:hypothetical protein